MESVDYCAIEKLFVLNQINSHTQSLNTIGTLNKYLELAAVS